MQTFLHSQPSKNVSECTRQTLKDRETNTHVFPNQWREKRSMEKNPKTIKLSEDKKKKEAKEN